MVTDQRARRGVAAEQAFRTGVLQKIRQDKVVEGLVSHAFGCCCAKSLQDQRDQNALREIFNKADTNKNGEIEIGELRYAINLIPGLKIDDDDLERLFFEIDANCNHTIDIHEFITFMLRAEADISNLEHTDDGNLKTDVASASQKKEKEVVKEELSPLDFFSSLGFVSQEKVEALFDEADADHGGTVDLEEFMWLVTVGLKVCSKFIFPAIL